VDAARPPGGAAVAPGRRAAGSQLRGRRIYLERNKWNELGKLSKHGNITIDTDRDTRGQIYDTKMSYKRDIKDT